MKGSFQRSREQSQRLTAEFLCHVLQVENLDKIENIEIILTTCTDLDGGGLALCRGLRSLVMIDTALNDIGPIGVFQSVSRTLRQLDLSQQKIKKMHNLDLPHLSELYLQENIISKIEGLDGCPNLRRLWLHGNRIARIDDGSLHCVGNLQELWLQGNNIKRIGGLESLVNLQYLGLAGNKINHFPDLDRLKLLPKLRSVSFDDIHFGCCPVVKMAGYRDFIMKRLNQIMLIDGHQITKLDRDEMETNFTNKVKMFNGRMEEIREETKKQLNILNYEEKNILSDAGYVESHMMRLLNDIEGLIRNGLSKINEESEKKNLLKKENRNEFGERLSSIARKCSDQCEEKIRQEKLLGSMEDKAFKLIRENLIAEYESEKILSLLERDNIAAFQQIMEHSPDFLLLDSFFSETQHHTSISLIGTNALSKLAIVQAYHCLPCSVKHDHGKSTDSDTKSTLYFCGSFNEVASFYKSLQGKKDEYDRDTYTLFSDPLLASELCSYNHKDPIKKQEIRDLKDNEDEEYLDDTSSYTSISSKDVSQANSEKENGKDSNLDKQQKFPLVKDSDEINFYFLVSCNVMTRHFQRKDLNILPTSPKELMKYISPNNFVKYEAKDVTQNIQEGEIICLRGHSLSFVKPRYFIRACRLGKGNESGNPRSIIRRAEAIVNEICHSDDFNEDLLFDNFISEYENQVDDQLFLFKKASSKEITLETARRESDAEKHVEKLKNQYEQTRKAIDDERSLQIRVINEMCRHDGKVGRATTKLQQKRRLPVRRKLDKIYHE